MAIQTNPTESWSYTLTTVFVLAAIAIGSRFSTTTRAKTSFRYGRLIRQPVSFQIKRAMPSIGTKRTIRPHPPLSAI